MNFRNRKWQILQNIPRQCVPGEIQCTICNVKDRKISTFYTRLITSRSQPIYFTYIWEVLIKIQLLIILKIKVFLRQDLYDLNFKVNVNLKNKDQLTFEYLDNQLRDFMSTFFLKTAIHIQILNTEIIM